MKNCAAALAVGALGLGVWGCGGSGDNNGTPESPTLSSGNTVTINVVAINGAQSFTPNPATVSVGQGTVGPYHCSIHPEMIGTFNK
jgi:plastocyanin